MGDAISSSSYSSLDLDLMDDLLIGGCWLETSQSDLFQPEPSTCASSTLDTSCLSVIELNNCFLNSNQQQLPQGTTEHQAQYMSNSPNAQHLGRDQNESSVEILSLSRNKTETGECSCQPEPVSDEYRKFSPSHETSQMLWIEPRANPSPVCLVRERLIQALNYIMESTEDSNVLVQIWLPMEVGGRHVLTTLGQPFSLDPSCQGLVNYRTVSVRYQFPAEENSNEAVGLPGRVFLGRLPEWTPDVRYFSSDEYPRIGHAERNDVRGTLALPVFEKGSQKCLGVVEVVLTTRKVNYRYELESICNALQAVDLRSSEVVRVPLPMVCNNSYQVALPEILEVLRAICETHRLPLAQAWVPCMQQGKKGSRHSDENYADCVSTVDTACYITDLSFCGFHEACSEHHLFKGQGLVGKAFTTNQPCFSPDIAAFSKSKYPLSHYAKMFKLRGAVAIRLRSIYTGTADFVLEFFLPTECQDSEEQKVMLNSLSMILQRVCRTLRVVTDKELEESAPAVSETISSGEAFIRSAGDDERQKQEKFPTEGKKPDFVKVQLKGKCPMMNTTFPEFQKEIEGSSVGTNWNQPQGLVGAGELFSEYNQHHQYSLKDFGHGSSSAGGPNVPNTGKATEKQRTKTEKIISLQVLRQYFAGSLKDAAKSIGVCPTTLKRICRQHGITRWPSRKIKKVGHSLKKLQLIIDSVQGVERGFQFTSLYDFPHAYGSDLNSPKLSASTLSTPKQVAVPQSSNMLPEDGVSVPPAAVNSPSSCSQSSSSSLCGSTGAQQYFHGHQQVVGEATSLAENEKGAPKRAYSETQLQALSTVEEKVPTHSLIHMSFSECHPPEISQFSMLPTFPHRPRDGNSVKVKVIYGEDMVRLSLPSYWGFQDLRQEIAKRFNIDDIGNFDVKYLDDDSEWVLLTCDDDLEECKDIYKSTRGHTIKFSIYHIAHVTSRGLS